MIVDDEKDVVTLLKYVLEKDGHRVSEAYNGAEALQKLGLEPEAASGGEPPDLILLDVMMPILDGYSLSSRLASNSRTRSIPIVVITAKGGMRDLFQLAPNVATYIEKPFDPHKLRELISSMLKSSRR
ncbi:MAG: response regulator [Elusimicrobia bacterium]|nr:response regulator [Elusimicrobiota bacterium]